MPSGTSPSTASRLDEIITKLGQLADAVGVLDRKADAAASAIAAIASDVTAIKTSLPSSSALADLCNSVNGDGGSVKPLQEVVAAQPGLLLANADVAKLLTQVNGDPSSTDPLVKPSLRELVQARTTGPANGNVNDPQNVPDLLKLIDLAVTAADKKALDPSTTPAEKADLTRLDTLFGVYRRRLTTSTPTPAEFNDIKADVKTNIADNHLTIVTGS